MKKFAFFTFFSALLLVSIPALAQKKQPVAVASVDLQKYAGTWFEIARMPNKYQKKCVGNITAVYSRKPDGDLGVVNQCIGSDGLTQSYKSEAKVVDRATNAKFKGGWGEYWIIDLDPKYQYAAVSDSKGETLWILGRVAKMSDTVYQGILRRIETMGFNPGKLNKTPQNVEVVKGAVIEKPFLSRTIRSTRVRFSPCMITNARWVSAARPARRNPLGTASF
jgi:apolipoprotein D and lipocalin family protein